MRKDGEVKSKDLLRKYTENNGERVPNYAERIQRLREQKVMIRNVLFISDCGESVNCEQKVFSSLLKMRRKENIIMRFKRLYI